MKKKLLTIISCFILCICALALTACGFPALTGGPNASDTVYGNGGFAVRKGEYMYFANSYSSRSIGENDNKYGSETLAAIYRVKLNSRGLVDTDDDGKVQNVEILARQIAGFKSSGIYIFDNYIYYATPKSLKVKSDVGSSELLEGLLSFERIKLDGTDHKTIYSINTLGEDLTYNFAKVGNNVCLTVLNNGELKTVLANKSESKTLATNVTSVVFPKVENIPSNYSVSEFDSYCYYTKTATIENDGYNGTMIAKRKLDGSKAEETLDTASSATMVEAKNNRVYFTLSDGILYSTDDLTFSANTNNTYSYNKLSSQIILNDDNSTDIGLVGLINTSIVYFRKGGEKHVLYTAESGKTVTLLYVENNNIFYTLGDNTLYSKVIYKNTYTGNEKNEEGTIHSKNINLTTDSTSVFDYDNSYFFYFNTVEESNKTYSYMHMVKTFETNEFGETFETFVGVLDSTDVLADEEE